MDPPLTWNPRSWFGEGAPEYQQSSRVGMVAGVGASASIFWKLYADVRTQYRYIGHFDIGPFPAHTFPVVSVGYDDLFLGAGSTGLGLIPLTRLKLEWPSTQRR